ncbi:MAG TPA: enoyl-CoA hydratase/isomerase family protein [Dehalococcoidia bacterium]|nr:enoyl-CoA hydratase/isomerase family protein [Dehalococcoidia bacterium]
MAPELVDYLLYEPEDSGILWIKFNRPDRMNALLVPETLQKLGEYMRAGDDDPNVRVIVVTGVGRAFSAGVDLRRTDGGGRERRREGPDSSREGFIYDTYPLFDALAEIRKPTIAMINGAAVGMGMDISLRCDLRVGCENTRFFTYQNVGQIIENGGMYWLPKIAGIGHALELLFTGGFLQGEEAYRWGILNKYVPSEQLENETRDLCDRIIKSPPLVQWIGKRIMRRSLDSSQQTVQDLCANAAGILNGSEDSKEAREAFFGKRSPVFKGR